MKVCIDPGHNNSGADTGAQGNGLHEELITLDIALRLKPLLKYNGIEVVMTRDSDFVKGPHGSLNESLQSRVDIANNAKADLFVSIHINAFANPGAYGQQVYIFGKGGKAEVCANKVLAQLISASGFYNRGVAVDNFEVLRETNMPAILTENGFITNPSDAVKLALPEFRQTLAVAHCKGICDYFGMSYREQLQTPPTPPPVPPVTQLDPDVNLVVWVPTSKAQGAIKGINSLGYYVEQFPLKLRRD